MPRDPDPFWLDLLPVTYKVAVDDSNQLSLKEKESPKNDLPLASNAMIDEFINSKKWIYKLHNSFGASLYEGIKFDRPANKCGNTRFAGGNQLLKLASSSKVFAGFNVDAEYLKESIVKFLDNLGWVHYEDDTNNFYNKNAFEETIIDIIPESGKALFESKKILKKVPESLISSCPLCQESYLVTYQNRSSGLCSRTMENRLRIVRQNGIVKTNTTSVICEACCEKAIYLKKCHFCGGQEHKDLICYIEYRSRNVPACEECAADRFSEDCFLTNIFSFQPTKLDIPANILHVGCEFECYIKPVKKSPKFNSKYVYQVKADGSLNSINIGIPIELVTQPLLDWREAAIKHICQELEAANVKTDNTCGGHIHVDARSLHLNLKSMIQLRHLFRLYEAAFFAICSRDRLDNFKYCAPVNWNDSPRSDRYQSMNLASVDTHNTVEFRCFNGSSDPNVWLQRIELSEGFLNFAAKQLQEPLTEEQLLNKFAIDSGCETWEAVRNTYLTEERSNHLLRIIKSDGAKLIQAAGTRFKLKPETTAGLIKQYNFHWKM